MSTVADIEKAITQLPPDQCKNLARWFLQYLEDLEDGLAAQKAEAEPGPRITHEALMKELGLR